MPLAVFLIAFGALSSAQSTLPPQSDAPLKPPADSGMVRSPDSSMKVPSDPGIIAVPPRKVDPEAIKTPPKNIDPGINDVTKDIDRENREKSEDKTTSQKRSVKPGTVR
ncbi:MAG: hypothetical protein C0521_12480 [Xanthomonas sp.]|nr:hypothetical protein [Xanthomonas sp.]